MLGSSGTSPTISTLTPRISAASHWLTGFSTTGMPRHSMPATGTDSDTRSDRSCTNSTVDQGRPCQPADLPSTDPRSARDAKSPSCPRGSFRPDPPASSTADARCRRTPAGLGSSGRNHAAWRRPPRSNGPRPHGTRSPGVTAALVADVLARRSRPLAAMPALRRRRRIGTEPARTDPQAHRRHRAVCGGPRRPPGGSLLMRLVGIEPTALRSGGARSIP